MCCQLCPPGEPRLVRSMEQLSPAGLIPDQAATTTKTSWPCSDMTHHLHTLHAPCAGKEVTHKHKCVCVSGRVCVCVHAKVVVAVKHSVMVREGDTDLILQGDTSDRKRDL